MYTYSDSDSVVVDVELLDSVEASVDVLVRYLGLSFFSSSFWSSLILAMSASMRWHSSMVGLAGPVMHDEHSNFSSHVRNSTHFFS
jgi:hypothetical protein